MEGGGLFFVVSLQHLVTGWVGSAGTPVNPIGNDPTSGGGSGWRDLFDGEADFSFLGEGVEADGTGGRLEAALERVPARWVVYLMVGENDAPVQLLCVRNLRQSLRRRLGTPVVATGRETGPVVEVGADPVNDRRGAEPQATEVHTAERQKAEETGTDRPGSDRPGPERVGAERRIDYRQIVRRVYWRRVDSAFEADLLYLAAVRQVFPATYTELIGFRPAWFLHVDVASAHPRYVRTTDLTVAGRLHEERGGVLLGPVEDRTSAGKLIEALEGAFDLCRYHQELLAAPGGRACAYKEMHRCPAPCDGSVSMQQYRQLVALSLRCVLDPLDAVREHEARMRQAAAELRFEIAGQIRKYVAELSELTKGPYRFLKRLEDFEYVSLQPGPRPGTAKVFFVSPWSVTHVASLVGEPTHGSALLRYLLEHACRTPQDPPDALAAERIAVVTAHLFAVKNTSGCVIHLGALEDRSLVKAYRDLQKQKAQGAEPGAGGGAASEGAAEPAKGGRGRLRRGEVSSADDEGVLRELQ